jgi:hypothetical protein
MNFFQEFAGYIKADDDIVQDRLDVCKSCEFLTPKFRCTQCGCFMKIKARLAPVKCPVGKW